jgi:hypothetical protein
MTVFVVWTSTPNSMEIMFNDHSEGK